MKITGTGACEGIAIAPVCLLRSVPVFSTDKRATQVFKEPLFAMVNNAIASLSVSLREQVQTLYARGETVKGEILKVYLAMLEDPVLIEVIQKYIREDYAPESAIQRAVEDLGRMLEQSGSGYIAQRSADLRDLGGQLTCAALGLEYPSVAMLTRDVILVAEDLPASMLAGVSPAHIRGIATVRGGVSSHTAIIAGSMGIPCVVGCGEALMQIPPEAELFLDGVTGGLEWGFDRERREYLVQTQKQRDIKNAELYSMADAPTRTLDGTDVELLANLSDLASLSRIRECRASGIGLYRTEFLFLERRSCPGEEEQFLAYRQAVQAMEGRTVVFRTLDVGGDKNVPFFQLKREENPFLGYRAVRLYGEFEETFCTQLRAILRASAWGPAAVMFPMISSVEEFLRTKRLFERAQEELRREGIPFDGEMQVGAMVEVPSAAVNADLLIRHADFFSIGTNDLTQYTLAVDRMNHSVADLYSHFNLAVLRLVRHAIRAADRWGKPCSICGEMASDGLAVPLLLGMGLRKFSVSPWSLLKVRKLISLCDVGRCRQLAEKVLSLSCAEDVLAALEGFLSPQYTYWLQ